MTIELKKGDILQETEGLILHGCNASGGFGSGIAGQIRKKYPQVYEAYKKHKMGSSVLGELQTIEIDEELFIGNGFTQLNYGYDNNRYADSSAIESVLYKACIFCYRNNLELKSPKIGCGLGGLKWEGEVEEIFNTVDSNFSKTFDDIKITIFEL